MTVLRGISVFGLPDNGKTSLYRVLTGIQGDSHSFERARKMTFRLSFDSFGFYNCSVCGYRIMSKDTPCCGATRPNSFNTLIDSPGHIGLGPQIFYSLSLADSAIFILSPESLGSEQAVELLKGYARLGRNSLTIAINKIDIFSREDIISAAKWVSQVCDSVGISYEIFPISTHMNWGIVDMIRHIDSLSLRDWSEIPVVASVLRSMDTNIPGTDLRDIQGGVLAIRGYKPISAGEVYQFDTSKGRQSFQVTKVISEFQGSPFMTVETDLDPFLTQKDLMFGAMIHIPDVIYPKSHSSLILATQALQRDTQVLVVGGHVTLGTVREDRLIDLIYPIPLIMKPVFFKRTGVNWTILRGKNGDIL